MSYELVLQLAARGSGATPGKVSPKYHARASWYCFKMLGNWSKMNAGELKQLRATLCLPLFISPARYGAGKWKIGKSEDL